MTIKYFMWMKDEGILAHGTDGVQFWDTSFLIQAVVGVGLEGIHRIKIC